MREVLVTVGRIGEFKLQVYSDDHLPAHFHIVGPDFEAVVRLSDLTILRGERHRRELKDALQWAADHLELLMDRWVQLNEH